MLTEPDVARLRGLTESEAAARLARDGANELPAGEPRRWPAIALDIVREPMLLLLLGCGGLYLLLGSAREALLLLGFVGVIIGVAFYQERKTERVLETLRDLSSPRAHVVRDGRERRIAGREVVRGDLLLLAEGDRVAADARLLWGGALVADEALLTGESAPVRKRAVDDAPPARPGGDDLPYVYAGTLIVRGRGVAEVQATGARSEIGRIGKALQGLPTETTPLQRETRRLVRRFALLGALLCLAVAIGYGLTRGDWLNGLLAGLTMAMAILPEEFPVVLAVFLALGAWRIAREQVLARHIPVVETLGAVTVLCVDKTGTLTQNRMSVARLHADGEYLDVGHAPGALPEKFHGLVEFAILASQRDPFDPMEQALRRLGETALAGTGHLHEGWTLVREYPLSPQLLALSHVWQERDGAHYVIAAKGAPEAIADLCHLAPAADAALAVHVAALAAEGLRVLGVARARFPRPPLPGAQHDFDFEFLGLVALADPTRASAPKAVRACRRAGVRVVMITGDHPETARRVAREIGLLPAERLLTGPQLDRLDDAALRTAIGDVNVFARTLPEQKLRLVQALKQRGEIVAMTGDGVNDAPALKAAHIGVAMGARGTDVAREAADLVLLDDDFTSLVAAVRLGRRVADNLRKAMAYILAVHVPIVGLSLLPVLFGWPLILTPVHVVFLELVIDPSCSIVFEAEGEEPDVMTRPPRDPALPLFDRRTLALSLLQGLGVLTVVLVIFAVTFARGQGVAEARALTFTALVIANLALILTNRSWSRGALDMLRSPNPALWWVTGGALVFLALALYAPPLRALFGFSLLHPADLVFCLGAGALTVFWFELFKHRRRARG